MKNLTLNNIAKACRGTYVGDSSLLSLEVTGAAIDSRKIEKGFLFIPIKGARADGHDFIPQVQESGAACCLSEKKLAASQTPYILVESCEQALKDIAAFYRTSLDIKVIGVTGSVGKTSTKEMIASVLSEKYNVLKTDGNFNNEIGLPLTIFRLREEHQVAILEMGISDFGEMHRLAGIARPDICVITNIGPCHLENLGDLDGVLKAKSEIFDFLEKDGTIFLNGEDPKLASVGNIHGIKPSFFGLDQTKEIFADQIKDHGLDGISCSLHQNGESFEVTIPIPGRHMVLNALAGASIGNHLGLTSAEIASGIAKLEPVDGRNKKITTSKLTILDDCYNANPISMKASIDVLVQAEGRRVAVLGDMFELGSDEISLHREIGIHIKERAPDLLICIGALSKATAEGAEGEDTEVVYFEDKQSFLEKMPLLVRSGDTILVKASHGMAFEEIVEQLTKF